MKKVLHLRNDLALGLNAVGQGALALEARAEDATHDEAWKEAW